MTDWFDDLTDDPTISAVIFAEVGFKRLAAIVAAHQRHSDGYTAGQGAAYKGQPISTCPYKPGDPQGADWRRGWLSAATYTRPQHTARDRDVVGTHGRVIAPARRTA